MNFWNMSEDKKLSGAAVLGEDPKFLYTNSLSKNSISILWWRSEKNLSCSLSSPHYLKYQITSSLLFSLRFLSINGPSIIFSSKRITYSHRSELFACLKESLLWTTAFPQLLTHFPLKSMNCSVNSPSRRILYSLWSLNV